MESTSVVSSNFQHEIQQQLYQVKRDIAYLLELANDPKKYNELIKILDPTVDKVNNHVTALHEKLIDELNKKIKEFEIILKPLDDPKILAGKEPPVFLSAADKSRLHKLIAAHANYQQLMDFKLSLIEEFRDELYKKLQIDQLTEQNVTIKRILAKIRQTLLI